MASLRFRRVPNSTPLFRTFFGAMDLKAGVNIVSLFAVLNKVAGVYGILAVFTGGAEGLQLTMYLYSILSLFALVWGIKMVHEENGPKSLIYAHLFALDHLISTVWTTLFAVIWYVYTPHDGRRVANSDAQKEMMGDGGREMDDATRKASAELVWQNERGFSALVLVAGWFLKVYFILLVYSFALHLRRGTYHTLPYARPVYSSAHTRNSSTGGAAYTHLRNSSIATIDEDLTGTLAETLWENDESFALDELKSPAAARGTGMTRSSSGGVLQRNESVSSQGGQGPVVEPSNNFTRILSKLDGDSPKP